VSVFSREVFTGPLPSNTRYTAPSLRLFVPNSLTVHHCAFASEGSARDVTFLWHGSSAVILSNRYIRSILKGAHPKHLPDKVPAGPGVIPSSSTQGLSVCLHVYVSVCLSICRPACVYVSIYLSILTTLLFGKDIEYRWDLR
jgi:hypothetical protein